MPRAPLRKAAKRLAFKTKWRTNVVLDRQKLPVVPGNRFWPPSVRQHAGREKSTRH